MNKIQVTRDYREKYPDFPMTTKQKLDVLYDKYDKLRAKLKATRSDYEKLRKKIQEIDLELTKEEQRYRLEQKK
jgi:hypothetical protein